MSSSKDGGIGDFNEASESVTLLDVVFPSRYPRRGLRSVKLESSPPCDKMNSSEKTLLNADSSFFTPSVDDLARPRSGSKFASNKSFNRCYAKNPLDLDRLSGYCTFSDGYAVFSPNTADRMWTPSHSGRHAIPDSILSTVLDFQCTRFTFLCSKPLDVV